MAFWWVNQSQSYQQELEAGILWAPVRTKEGRRQSHWETMTSVRPGDRVLHYASGVVAVSTVTTPAVDARQPRELPEGLWYGDGRLVRSTYLPTSTPVRLDEIPENWRIDHGQPGPFTSVGRVKQGYLFHLDEPFAHAFLQRFGSRFPSAAPPLPAEASDTAANLLRRLLGQKITTLRGQTNCILDVCPPNVLVSTDRSPKGRPIPIANVQAALDTLRTTGSVTIHPDDIGYRSAFIGAVLLTLPGVEAQGGTPPVIATQLSETVSSLKTNTTEPHARDQEAVSYEGDLNRPVTAAQRGEQSTLRRLLLGSATTAACALCGETYPVRFLVAAHIKMRSLCTDEERRDLAHIAMPACQFGCDALFEKGYISVNSDGNIVSAITDASGSLTERLAQLSGRPCLYFTEKSKKYYEWHYMTRFQS